MNIIRICASISVLLLALLVPNIARAQTADVFAFIPDGGRTLFPIAVEGASPDELRAILNGERTAEEWLVYLEGRGDALPGITDLDEYQRLTLADYLSYSMPIARDRIPPDPTTADWAAILPHDGRDLTLNECQFCHIVTVVVTQLKTREAWLGTMHKPSHIEIRLTEREREALASYLVLNAAIPIDLVPEELRAGGASY